MQLCMLNRRIFSFFAIATLAALFLYSCSKEAEVDKPVLSQTIGLSNVKGKVPVATLSPMAQLGKLIFFDNNLSESGNPSEVLVQSCASCHLPEQGFIGFDERPLGGIPRGFVAGFAEGAVAGRIGSRMSPSAAYATFSPVLARKRGTEAEFIGGLFWDGHATGIGSGKPAVDQAKEPFLSPFEQNHPSPLAVLNKIRANTARYGTLWRQVWGSDISTATASAITTNYDRVAQSIVAYESSSEVNQFSSKFDAYLRGQTTLAAQELAGLQLFNTKAKCSGCHVSAGTTTSPPLFTDFGYDNVGVPRNPSPFAPQEPDLGLGGFLAKLKAGDPWIKLAPLNNGRFKTPTVRNVGKATSRRFMHNGVFTSLEQVVHFYNTRDVPGEGWNGVPWGIPEVNANIEVGDTGNLQLTAEEEAAIVAFLRTLTDGWVNN